MLWRLKKEHFIIKWVFFPLKGTDPKTGLALGIPLSRQPEPFSHAVFWDPSSYGPFRIIPIFSHVGVLLSPTWLKDLLWQEFGSLCPLGSSQYTVECWDSNRSPTTNYFWDCCSAPWTEPPHLFLLLPGCFLKSLLVSFNAKPPAASLRSWLHSNLPFS